MAIINQRYKVVLTDDYSTDPIITQEINYTNSLLDNHVTKTLSADSSGDGSIHSNIPVAVIVASDAARYVVIKSTKRLRMYISATLPIDIDSYQFMASELILDGSINNLWAVNTDTEGNDAEITVFYVY